MSNPLARRFQLDQALLVLLGLLVALPATAVFVGIDDGKVVFLLYREPKLAVIMILGWVFLAAATCVLGRRLTTGELRSIVVVRPVLLLGLLVVYLGLTSLWVLVPANAAYELRQYLMLYVLLVVLLAWDRRDSRVSLTIRRALVGSIGLLTVIGVLQAAGLLQAIEPINPYHMVGHPSLMGYKNPMAMAVLGQLFVLGWLLVDAVQQRNNRRTSALGLLLITELVYLISLQSRASIVGLAAGCAVVIVLLMVRGPSLRKAAIASAILLVVVGCLFTVSAVNQRVGERFRSALAYVADPASFIDSDRGTYLVNTINMARFNVFGVGVGDWQTQYPVYRVHNRGLAFDEIYQVRRAHSDHVQILGEAGWPGLGLWFLFLVMLMVAGVRGWTRGGHVGALLMAAQIAAVIAAMGLDYVLEHPYGKFQFVLIVLLTLSASSEARSSARPKGTWLPGLRTIFAVTMLALALLNSLYFVAFSRKIVAGAHLTRDYLRAMPPQGASSDGAPRPAIDLGRMQRVVSRGRDFAILPGHTKAMFRDYVLLADSAYQVGRLPAAKVYLTRSLVLHPHNPPSFRLAARLQMDPGARRQWETAAEFIMDEATEGYSRAYPPGHPLAKTKESTQPSRSLSQCLRPAVPSSLSYSAHTETME